MNDEATPGRAMSDGAGSGGAMSGEAAERAPSSGRAASERGASAQAPPAAPEPLDAGAVPTVAKPFRLQFEEAQDAWVLLYPEGMVKLNRSAGETLARCDGERAVGDIVASLEEAFGRTGLEADVRGFLGVARARGWVRLA